LCKGQATSRANVSVAHAVPSVTGVLPPVTGEVPLGRAFVSPESPELDDDLP
jgi:hypothetical protein